MTIREALIELLKDKFAFNLRIGTVGAGSVSGGYCEVIPIDTEGWSGDNNGTNDNTPGIALQNVRIQAGTGNGITPIPADGSIVIIGELNPSDYCILLYSELASIKFLDGSFGGLVEVANLVAKINRLENAMNNHVHSGVTTGAGSSGPIVSPISPLTNRTDMENTNIIHGNP